MQPLTDHTDCGPAWARAKVNPSMPCSRQHCQCSSSAPVQESSSSGIPLVLSDFSNRPGATVTDTRRSLHDSSRIPRSALNPAYEYALPTEVANLMAGPCVETEDVGAHGVIDTSSLRGQAGGCWKSLSWLQLPMLAATESPKAAPHRCGAIHPTSGRSSGGGDGTLRGSNSAPVYSYLPGRNVSVLLGTHSTHSAGNTIIISPYILTDSSARMMTRCSHDLSTTGSTGASTRSWYDDDETLPPSPPPPQQQEMSRVHTGGSRDTVSTSNSSGIHEALRGQQRQCWQRNWLPSSARTPPADCIVGSIQSARQLMARLQRRLDAFRENDLFLRRFEMLGSQNRRRGGAFPVLFTPPRGWFSGGAAFSSSTMSV